VNKKIWGPTVCLLWLCATPVFSQSAASASPESALGAAKLEVLRKAVADTPYSALVIHTKVEIAPLPVRSAKPKKAVEEVSGDERHTYYARVLETFKGTAYATIRYEMLVEKGESATLDSKPQVLTLCKGPRGFYWPGVGASFPGEVELIALARRAAKQPVASAKVAASQCD
jgi:uncharacterized protein (UPF0210 family)